MNHVTVTLPGSWIAVISTMKSCRSILSDSLSVCRNLSSGVFSEKGGGGDGKGLVVMAVKSYQQEAL